MTKSKTLFSTAEGVTDDYQPISRIWANSWTLRTESVTARERTVKGSAVAVGRLAPLLGPQDHGS